MPLFCFNSALRVYTVLYSLLVTLINSKKYYFYEKASAQIMYGQTSKLIIKRIYGNAISILNKCYNTG